MTIRNRKTRPPILWITDPWDTLDHANDTTLRLCEEGLRMGIPQSWCDVKSIRLEEGKVRLEARSIDSPGSKASPWGNPRTCEVSQFRSIHYRVDPPVDQAYLQPLRILALELLKNGKVEIVNPLDVLLCQNEKLEAQFLGPLMPQSFVGSQWEALLRFGKAQGKTVLKPLHEAQSHGIELLKWNTADEVEQAKKKVEIATSGFTTPIILQRFLEGISDGEVRLWFLDGKLLANVRKLPLSGDFRVNMDLGSKLAPYSLSALEKKKIPVISKHLKARRIRLAAIDLIEGYITDFNFTSPGLIRQMESILSENLSQPIVSALAGRYPS